MQGFQHLGYWWLPETPDRRVPGTLTLADGKGLRLALLGTLGDLDLDQINVEPIILGAAPLKAFTLCDCPLVATGGSSDLLTAEYAVNMTLLGDHFHSQDAMRFRRITASFSRLFEWVALSGFRTEILEADQEPDIYRVVYGRPELPTAVTNRGTVSIVSSFQFVGRSRHPPDEVNLRESFCLQVDAPEPISVHEWRRIWIFPLQSLLSLATSEENFVPELHVQVEADDSPLARRIQVVSNVTHLEESPREPLRRWDMFFTLGDMGDKFPEMMGRWLDLAERLDDVLPLIFDLRYRNAVYAENRFLSAAKLASYFARDNNDVVKLSIKPGDGEYAPGALTISANAAEVGDNTSDIDAAVEGPEGQIAFNVRYLSDVLSALKTPQVALEMQGSSSAGVIRPVGSGDSTHVIMPMHLASY
jgi:hypothetical protein